jgi:acyl-CoA synthetase (AMP-forming)/AMP-acid ligase II
MDVTSAMRRAATFFAGREAVVHGKDRLTFAAAWERGCRMANGLRALGLEPGDRVAVLEDNSKEAADFFLGAGIANLVRVPYKKPGKVVVREEPLPKTPVGKIKRRDLREPFWVGHTRRVAGS